MLEQFRSDAINDCLRRAEEARRTAEATNNTHTRAEYLEFERRWLSLARGFATETERATEQLAA
jgi:predicted adenine nucleotide alpha hydrolase (AANH) superfamily ATPase